MPNLLIAFAVTGRSGIDPACGFSLVKGLRPEPASAGDWLR